MSVLKGWALGAAALIAAVWGVVAAGPEWAEAIVQGVAALGGFGYWLYATRPRPTLTVRSYQGLIYIDIVNMGNRIAKQVSLHSDPPVGLHSNQSPDRHGLDNTLGDMARDQKYTFVLSFSKGQTLQKTAFILSHKHPFGFGRQVSTLALGGEAWAWSLQEQSASPTGAMVESISSIERSLKQIDLRLQSVDQKMDTLGGGRFSPPPPPPPPPLSLPPQ